MAEITTYIPATCFPSEVDAIHVSADAGETVDITISLGGETVFQTSLMADSSGNIALEDLSEFFDNLLQGTAKTCTVTADEDSETFTLYPCKVKPRITAVQFLNKSFLSLLNGPKPTFCNAVEFLTYVDLNSANDTPVISAVWINPNTAEIQTTSGELTPSQADGYGLLLNVSPSVLTAPADGYLLHSYAVTAGSRTQKYIIRKPVDITPVSILFTNAFGQLETFHCFGTSVKETKPKYSAASYAGRTRNYLVETVPEWKVYTGPLNEAILHLFEDVATSMKAWRISDGEELTITDCEMRISNDRYAEQNGTITFRESGRTQSCDKILPVQTFDATFDNTFD